MVSGQHRLAGLGTFVHELEQTGGCVPVGAHCGPTGVAITAVARTRGLPVVADDALSRILPRGASVVLTPSCSFAFCAR